MRASDTARLYLSIVALNPTAMVETTCGIAIAILSVMIVDAMTISISVELANALACA